MMLYPKMFDEPAQNAINYAFRLAHDLRHSFVASEHILWALSHNAAGETAKVLHAAGLDETVIRQMIEKYDGIGVQGTAEPQGITPDTARIIESAKKIAQQNNSEKIGCAHLLFAILHERQCLATRMIIACGANPENIAIDLINAIKKNIDAGKKEAEMSTKTLDQFSHDLTALAKEGKLDPVIGRADEIQRIIQILSRRTKNNPVLIGEPGVGKTAVAEGLAQRVVAGDVPETLTNKRIVSLDLAKMVSGTKYRGDFEERIKNMLDEVIQEKNTILFIDEMHTLIGAGSAEGSMDAANIIKPALSRGELQVIGATTLNEYRKHIEKDAALERRFQPVIVDEPSAADAVAILKGLRSRYEEHHKLKITDEAIEAAVKLSIRYINDRYLPDKAIDLIDEAASRVRTTGRTAPAALKDLENRLTALNNEKAEAVKYQDYERAAMIRDMQAQVREELQKLREEWQVSGAGGVIEQDIAAVVASWTGIPVTMLTEDESARLLRMEEILHQRVIGQQEAVTSVSKAIRRGRVGLKDPKRPIGSFLFLGPTGVGKTELCKALAASLFGDEQAMLRVDMSEFMERHTVSKLIGSPPGYVGYEEGGQLTEKVRRKPYSVILFDEIEKAHPDVFNILLQVMEDGILTDSQGRRVDFRNTVVVMTSNVGAKNITDKKKRLGFDGNAASSGETVSVEQIREAVMGDLRATFKPEFLNRIDDTIVFHQLSRTDIREIARNMLVHVEERMSELGIVLETQESALDILAEKGFDPLYGARPLRRYIQSAIEDAVAEKILDGSIQEGDIVTAGGLDGKIAILAPQQTSSAATEAAHESL